MPLEFVGFRGVKHGYEKQHALIQIGHVGLTHDGGQHIFGFRPSDKTVGCIGTTEEALELFGRKCRLALRGAVDDDTFAFERAYELSLSDQRLAVYAWEAGVGTAEARAVMAKIHTQKSNPKKIVPPWYALPIPGKDMPTGEQNNCVTWPTLLGVPILEKTGMVSLLLVKVYDELLPKGQARIWEPP